MVSAFTFSVSEIVGLCIESVLYGMYLILFFQCMSILYSKRKTSGPNVRLSSISVALFVLITWHEVIDAYRLVTAFERSEVPQGADLFYANVTSVLSIMKTALYLVMTVLSDFFMLYRTFVVWNQSLLIVALPSLLVLADIGVGIVSVYTLATPSINPTLNTKQERITNTFFGCTFALNALCTILIAFRIMWNQRRVRATRISSNITQVAVIVLESGAIYVVTLACLVGTYAAQSLTFNIFLDMMSPIIGIVFALIIVRVSQGISSDQTTYEVPSKMSFAIPVRGTGRQPGESYSLGTMTHDDHNGGSAFSDTMAGSYHTKGELKPGVNVETDYIVSV
ncbi:hypothetical protein BC629DRAFT_491300 [Irpex lacteus]|nr:hypothetical protein BC629DRAFT_491300 [Irpex lacteus]